MTVRDIFDSMDYGPAPESSAEALAWLGQHGNRFGNTVLFRNGI
jgi:aldehyde dehydrogenase (NAD+)